MAPLAPSNTPRFRVHYTSMAHGHTMQFRSHASPATFGSFVDGLLGRLDPAIAPLTIDSVDFAPAGSDIFNPVTTAIEGNTYGSSGTVPEMAAWAFTFVGRTSGGRRVRVAVFGADSLGDNYRFNPAESAVLDDARDFLAANPSFALGIDDVAAVWKAYVNVQVNDHWVKELRP
jgi:hypothetical protein